MLVEKQILFPQQCFHGWANRETFEETSRITHVSTTMFPSLPRALALCNLIFFRDVTLKQKRAFRNAAVGEPAVEDGTRKRRKKKIQAVLDVTRTDIEEALVDLQIKTDVCVYQCETDEDVALKIAVFTKAVAERPYKYDLQIIIDCTVYYILSHWPRFHVTISSCFPHNTFKK